VVSAKTRACQSRAKKGIAGGTATFDESYLMRSS
jgi:hypothetical protein